MELLQGLQDLDVVRAIRTSAVYYPLLNGTHIMGFALLMGAIVSHDLNLLGVIDGKTNGALRVAKAGFLIAFITGLLLFATRATHYVENTAFLVKCGLLVLAIGNIVAFGYIRQNRLQKLSAITSLVSWIGILYAGRWIGFV